MSTHLKVIRKFQLQDSVKMRATGCVNAAGRASGKATAGAKVAKPEARFWPLHQRKLFTLGSVVLARAGS